MMKLFNTLTREVEPLRPHLEGHVSVYACGPTVYKHAHIGNFRTYVFEDVLVRTLRSEGHKVRHVMNITDVGHLQSDADSGDDKVSAQAARERRDPWEIARHYEAEFFRHAAQLKIERPDIVCRATEHIAEIIEMVKRLLERGAAYVSGGNVYFSVASFPSYHELGRLQLADQMATDRVELDPLKRDQADFALWFSTSKFPNQVMKWASPWGLGFPGWHIECSAMACRYLGEHLDIHCGGVDHIGVHHSNEIAQSESCIGHRWVSHWFHCDFLVADAGKMSKSSGDFLTVDTLVAQGYDPLAYRLLVLGSHYRGTLTFSWEALESAAGSLKRLRQRAAPLRDVQAPPSAAPSLAYKRHARAFREALTHDLRTPLAMAELWAVLKSDALVDWERSALLRQFDDLLRLDVFAHEPASITQAQRALILARDEARLAKNWAEADRLRELLLEQGLSLADGKSG